jgi:hypothetical protein
MSDDTALKWAFFAVVSALIFDIDWMDRVLERLSEA